MVRAIGWTSGNAIAGGYYSQVNFDYLTTLAYAALQPVSSTNPALVMRNGPWSHLSTIVTDAHSRGKRAAFSIYDDISRGGCFNAFVNNGLLAQFAANVAQKAQQYGFDEVEIDHEDWSEPGPTFPLRKAVVDAIYAALNPIGVEVVYYSAALPIPGSFAAKIGWMEVNTNPSVRPPTEDSAFNDTVNAAMQLYNLGWPKEKLGIVFRTWADYMLNGWPSTACAYGDVLAAGLDVHQSSGSISVINSVFWGANWPVPGGKLYWDGINKAKRITDWMKANGFPTMTYFTSDNDAIPNNDSDALLRNVWEAMAGSTPTNYIKIAAADSPSAWKSQANYVCSGVADQNIINAHLLDGKEVDLGPGPANYWCNGEIRPQSNVSFHGQGAKCTTRAIAASTAGTRPTIHFDGSQYQSGIHIYSVSNVTAGIFNLAGLTDTGAVGIFPNVGPVDNIVLQDIYSTIKGKQGVLGCGNVFLIYGFTAGPTTDIAHIRCWTDEPDGFGFIIDGEGTPVVDGVTYFRCGVRNAGVAATRAVVSDGSSWVCGIDTAEAAVLTVRNVAVIACNVDGTWEDDFHAELAPAKHGFVYLDNVATRAGQKPQALFGAGYLMPFNYTDDFVMVGNTGSNNKIADQRILEPDVDYHNYSPPIDYVWPVGTKTTYRLNQGNCTGIAVQAGGATTWDVYLYSTDGNAVNQQMTLPDTTPFPAVFEDYLITRNVSGTTAPPNTFPAGAVKTASVTVKVTPGGVAMSAEVWLGPNPTTKVATSGKRNFTSTGNNQNVACPVTMPSTPGTYHVYMDLYQGATLVGTYVANQDVTVTGGTTYLYHVAVTITPAGAGTVTLTPGGTVSGAGGLIGYDVNQQVVASYTQASGHVFSHWMLDGTNQGTMLAFTSGDRNLQAVFS